jgi:hypothetical protein
MNSATWPSPFNGCLFSAVGISGFQFGVAFHVSAEMI